MADRPAPRLADSFVCFSSPLYTTTDLVMLTEQFCLISYCSLNMRTAVRTVQFFSAKQICECKDVNAHNLISGIGLIGDVEWPLLCIHSFIHSENLYSALSRKLLRGAPSPIMMKKISFKQGW